MSRPAALDPRLLGFAALFAAALAIGLYAAYAGTPSVTWREIDAHYAEMGGPDESGTPYEPRFCAALANSLRLNANAYARHPTIATGRASRIPLAEEFERHCQPR